MIREKRRLLYEVIFMKEKLKKAKNFICDHKETILYVAIVGGCCAVWYGVGRLSGKKAALTTLQKKLYPAVQVEDLDILYQGKLRGANYTVSGCMSRNNLITLKELCTDAQSFSGVVNEETPVVAYTILFKM